MEKLYAAFTANRGSQMSRAENTSVREHINVDNGDEPQGGPTDTQAAASVGMFLLQ